MTIKIKWRTQARFNYVVLTGLSSYTTVDAAQKQINIWKRVFPNNTYDTFTE